MTEPSLRDVIRTCPHLSASVHRTDKNREEKNRKEQTGKDSPNPSSVGPKNNAELVLHHLEGGLAWLSENDHGRPWPNPNRATIARCLSEYPADLCVKAAREAREIVQVQDRAPNVTGLFEKKLRDLAAKGAQD